MRLCGRFSSRSMWMIARFAALELAAPEELHDWTLRMGNLCPLPSKGCTMIKSPQFPPGFLSKAKIYWRIAMPFLPRCQLQLEASPEGEPFDLKPKYSWRKVRIAGFNRSKPLSIHHRSGAGLCGNGFFYSFLSNQYACAGTP